MIKSTREDRIFNIINISILTLFFIIVLYPLVYVLSASISDPLLVAQGKMWLYPKRITYEGFERVLRHKELWMSYRNTIFYTISGTIINLLLTLTCAYALSRKDFVGRKFFTLLFVFTMYFSGGLIPTYLLVKSLGFYNTIWSMIIPGAVATWNIIIARTYFQTSIPIELKESAEIDGCSNTRLFVSIVLPLSLPIVSVLALFYGVGHWNAYFGAFIYLSNRKLFPLQLILREILILNQTMDFMSSSDVETMIEQIRIAEIIKYSVMIVSTLPIILVYPFLQKYFVKGVMIGSIKG